MNKEPPELPELSKKDRIDAMLQRANAEWKDMDGRRIYEWRVSFALWTATGVFAGLALNRDPKLPPIQHPNVLAGLLCFAGLVYTFSWTKGLRERNLRNLETAFYFWCEVDKQIDAQSPRRRRRG
jgi:hypothetical protein